MRKYCSFVSLVIAGASTSPKPFAAEFVEAQHDAVPTYRKSVNKKTTVGVTRPSNGVTRSSNGVARSSNGVTRSSMPGSDLRRTPTSTPATTLGGQPRKGSGIVDEPMTKEEIWMVYKLLMPLLEWVQARENITEAHGNQPVEELTERLAQVWALLHGGDKKSHVKSASRSHGGAGEPLSGDDGLGASCCDTDPGEAPPCRPNIITRMVDRMIKVGSLRKIDEATTGGFPSVEDYGTIIRTGWFKPEEWKQTVLPPSMLQEFVNDMIDQSSLHTVKISDLKQAGSSGNCRLPMIYYQEEGDVVKVCLDTQHEVTECEDNKFALQAAHIVHQVQGSMALFLLLIDLCGGTKEAREVLTKFPLHYYIKRPKALRLGLGFNLHFEVQKSRFAKFLSALQGAEEVPWRLERGSSASELGRSAHTTTLFNADVKVIPECVEELWGNAALAPAAASSCNRSGSKSGTVTGQNSALRRTPSYRSSVEKGVGPRRRSETGLTLKERSDARLLLTRLVQLIQDQIQCAKRRTSSGGSCLLKRSTQEITDCAGNIRGLLKSGPLFGIPLPTRRNMVTRIVGNMISSGKQFALKSVTETRFGTPSTHCGDLVQAAWYDPDKREKTPLQSITLKRFIRKAIRDSTLAFVTPGEQARAGSKSSMSTETPVLRLYYTEKDDTVEVRLDVHHTADERGSNGYPLKAAEMVLETQGCMAMLLVMLDLCGSTTSAREALTQQPLFYRVALHDEWTLTVDQGLFFKVEKSCFEQFLAALEGIEKLPWVLKKASEPRSPSDYSGSGYQKTSLFDADITVIPACAEELWMENVATTTQL